MSSSAGDGRGDFGLGTGTNLYLISRALPLLTTLSIRMIALPILMLGKESITCKPGLELPTSDGL